MSGKWGHEEFFDALPDFMFDLRMEFSDSLSRFLSITCPIGFH